MTPWKMPKTFQSKLLAQGPIQGHHPPLSNIHKTLLPCAHRQGRSWGAQDIYLRTHFLFLPLSHSGNRVPRAFSDTSRLIITDSPFLHTRKSDKTPAVSLWQQTCLHAAKYQAQKLPICCDVTECHRDTYSSTKANGQIGFEWKRKLSLGTFYGAGPRGL